MNIGSLVDSNKTLQVVIINASLGTLDSYKNLFSKLIKKNPMSFIIVGNDKSTTPAKVRKFLKKYTHIPICIIEKGVKLQNGMIYITHQNIKTSIHHGIFELGDFDDSFSSMGDLLNSFVCQQIFQLAIVLISDCFNLDIELLKKIKNAGALIIVQSTGSLFNYILPRNIMHSGYVDLVLSPEDINIYLENFYINEANLNMIENCIEEKEMTKLRSQFSNYQIELEMQNDALIQAQIDLSKQRDKYHELYDSAPITCLTLSSEGLIVEINQAGADLFGITKNHLINRSFSRYIDPNYQAIFKQHKQNVLKSITTHACELKILKRKGSLFYAQVISKLMQNSETDKPRILMFIYDISDQKKTHDSLHQHQVRLAHVDRLNSTNTLAAILAHEINNPIGVIINYINGCIHRLKNNSYKVDDLVNVLNRTSDQIKHIAEITLRLKNFSCKEQLQLESHCINEVIHEVIDFIYYETIDFPISITHRPLKYAKKILFDKIHIQQVILNLARNAIEAMQEAKIEDPKLIIETNLLNPSTIEISVNDNGPGISEYKHKLFDLHFTTKPYGTGLGLAVSRAIVEAHQGELSFENNHWNGASFKFTLRLKA